MSKHVFKKIHCICKGKTDRVHPGTDHQKHIKSCPLTVENRKN